MIIVVFRGDFFVFLIYCLLFGEFFFFIGILSFFEILRRLLDFIVD